jgi:hypothetical protein
MPEVRKWLKLASTAHGRQKNETLNNSRFPCSLEKSRFLAPPEFQTP